MYFVLAKKTPQTAKRKLLWPDEALSGSKMLCQRVLPVAGTISSLSAAEMSPEVAGITDC